MDCVIHAVNLLLGFPYFKSREQFLKVYTSLKHHSLKQGGIEKETKGLRLYNLKHLVASDKAVYSPML